MLIFLEKLAIMFKNFSLQKIQIIDFICVFFVFLNNFILKGRKMLFLEKLKQNRIYIFLVLIICVFAGIFYAFKFTPKEYVSSSTMMLIKTKNGEEKSGGLELTNNLISTFEEIDKELPLFEPS